MGKSFAQSCTHTHTHTHMHTAKEPKEEGGAQIKSAPNQVDFEVSHCQSTAGLINSPLAGIIVQAVFEIHQRNADLL